MTAYAVLRFFFNHSLFDLRYYFPILY